MTHAFCKFLGPTEFGGVAGMLGFMATIQGPPKSWRHGLMESSCMPRKANAELCICRGITLASPAQAEVSQLGSGWAGKDMEACQIHGKQESTV